MTLAELADALFPGGHSLSTEPSGAVSGTATTQAGIRVGVVGIAEGKPVGIDAALAMAETVLAHVAAGGHGQGVMPPLVMLVDTQSQQMARRDELLGLNEYLAHLCKSMALASFQGHRTIGILYGRAAAGAFIATALSTDLLVAVPGAEPSVMDLPSIARITKLPLRHLEDMAKSTPIFAPGLEHLAATGAVRETWNDPGNFASKLDALLSGEPPAGDVRDQLGAERRGRLRAHEIANRVIDAATAGHQAGA